MASLNHRAIVPQKLELDSKFRFRCYPGISCFTRCCSGIEILLTPYDVVRMKNRLGLNSTTFLQRHTWSRIDEKTTQPLLFIKLNDDEERLCPFVVEKEGCTIYTDRPAACRYYPIGQTTHRRADESNQNAVHDEWYVMVREKHCLGFDENREWSVAQWRDDQESSLYDEMNREWKNIMMKQDLPRDKIEERRQKMFYMASYDLDSFRRYVLESRFLELFDVGDVLVEKISADDVELMHFAVKYLKYLLGIQPELNLKPHVREEQERFIAEKRAREDMERAEREAAVRAGKEPPQEE
ncbi:MAG: YkgJ family cysteine cluster protein [Thermoleophilia bacterium]|nr:YkgJ family cysteine cluster protein [Thermoleophilia bacterium]